MSATALYLIWRERFRQDPKRGVRGVPLSKVMGTPV